MPIDYSKYPPNWKTQIRPAILERANNCCEECGVKNYAIGWRDEEGRFIEAEGTLQEDTFHIEGQIKIFKIVLTVAHLDHDPENWDVSLDRLKALCQKCHINYDIPERKKKAYLRRHKNQILIPFNS